MYRPGRRDTRKGVLDPLRKDAEFQSQVLMLRQYRLAAVSTDSLSGLKSVFYLLSALPWESNSFKQYVGISILCHCEGWIQSWEKLEEEKLIRRLW